MEIDENKKYRSNGKRIKILRIDSEDSLYPIIGEDEEGTVHYFTKDGESMFGETYNLAEEWEPWEPKKGQWCLFWEDFNEDDIWLGVIDIHIGKFARMNGEYFESSNGAVWSRCMEFTGELPEFIKNITKGE